MILAVNIQGLGLSKRLAPLELKPPIHTLSIKDYIHTTTYYTYIYISGYGIQETKYNKRIEDIGVSRRDRSRSSVV